MIVSHRHHRFEGARVECDRWILPQGILRRVLLTGMTQEERLTLPALGRGIDEKAHARLMLVVRGELRATVEGQSTTLLPGAVVVTETLEGVITHTADALTFSVDWASGRLLRGSGHLGTRARGVVEAACGALGDSRTSHEEVRGHMRALYVALAAEGIELEGLGGPIPDCDPAEQTYASVMDGIFSSLQSGPASIDWEGRTGATRRTLTRRTHAFHQKYRLFGLRQQTDWRAVKDFYRLLLSSIFLTHKNATVSSVARAVGYGSPAALCHAFAQVGLPPPGRLRALVAAE